MKWQLNLVLTVLNSQLPPTLLQKSLSKKLLKQPLHSWISSVPKMSASKDRDIPTNEEITTIDEKRLVGRPPTS